MTTSKNPKLSPLQNAAVSRKLIEAEIVSRAWEDAAYRRQLEMDPRAALAAAGLEIPDNFRIIVKNEPTDVLQVTLPPKPDSIDELDEAELKAVAGGATFTVTVPKGGQPRDENAAKAAEFYRQVNRAIYAR